MNDCQMVDDEFTVREVKFAFLRSMQTETDEQHTDEHRKMVRDGSLVFIMIILYGPRQLVCLCCFCHDVFVWQKAFVEFMEAIGRVADMKNLTEPFRPKKLYDTKTSNEEQLARNENSNTDEEIPTRSIER